MKSRNYFVLLNPVAGKGRYTAKLHRIRDEFNRRGIRYKVFETYHYAKAFETVRQNLDHSEFTDLLIMGGDGTINEALNGLRDRKTPVSVISMGTGNDTVKHFQRKRDFESQLTAAFDGMPTQVDAGICNGKIFLNGVGIGFDGKVVEILQKRGKRFGGHLTYLRIVLSILLSYREKEISVEIDGKQLRLRILLMSIAKGNMFGGGFMINPYAQKDDGLLDICTFGSVPHWMRIFYLPKMKNGGHRHLKVVDFYKARHLKIDASDDLVAHMDGEFIGNPPFDISILPDAFLFRV